MSSRTNIKRETDLQILSGWIESNQRVLDLGCGRGILLEHLQKTKSVWGVGVDNDFTKIKSCVKRGVNAYQGDAILYLKEMPDNFCDWVILSRTLQDLGEPERIIAEALRVGRNLAIGFANYGYWKNRISIFLHGSLSENEVFPSNWAVGTPYNPITIKTFEAYCFSKSYKIVDKAFLRGNWKKECKSFPNGLAGYALYHLQR